MEIMLDWQLTLAAGVNPGALNDPNDLTVQLNVVIIDFNSKIPELCSWNRTSTINILVINMEIPTLTYCAQRTCKNVKPHDWQHVVGIPTQEYCPNCGCYKYDMSSGGKRRKSRRSKRSHRKTKRRHH
jgi:hypothetical protein